MREMRLRPAIAIAVCCTTLLGGCGSSAEPESIVTTVETESADTSAVDTTAETESANASSDRENFDAYLADVAPLQARFLRLQEIQGDALDNASAMMVGDPKFQRALEQGQRDFAALAVDLAALDPPDELAEAHAGMVKSVEERSIYLDEMAYAVEKGDVQRLHQAATTGRGTLEQRATWRTAVLAHAKRVGADAPEWVNGVGTQN